VGYLAVAGHTNIDYLAHVERLPGPHESMEFTGTVRALGGTAANIALASARLGVPTALLSFVGPDFPREFARELDGAGVDTRAVEALPGATTPVCWVFTDRRERQVAFIHQGSAAQADRRAVPTAAIARARVLHLATGRAKHHMRAAAEGARRGLEVYLDPGQELSYVWTPATLRAVLEHCDGLFLNEHEMRVAMRYLGARRAEDLLDHVGLIVGTRGGRGSFALTADGRVAAPAIRPRRVENSTGAGDVFRGGFHAAKYRSLPLRDCLRWGAAAASLAIERPTGAPAGLTVAALRRRMRRRPA